MSSLEQSIVNFYIVLLDYTLNDWEVDSVIISYLTVASIRGDRGWEESTIIMPKIAGVITGVLAAPTSSESLPMQHFVEFGSDPDVCVEKSSRNTTLVYPEGSGSCPSGQPMKGHSGRLR